MQKYSFRVIAARAFSHSLGQIRPLTSGPSAAGVRRERTFARHGGGWVRNRGLPERRRLARPMVRAGKTRVEAAETVGVNRRFVGQWVKLAAQGGEAVLAGRRRGRRPGEQKALSAAQEEGLRYLIARGCPDQFGLSFALWTRQAVRALIARETGVWLTLPVIGCYLRAWGFT